MNKHRFSQGTLQITPPFGKTIWLTLIFLFFLGGTAEGLARSEFFEALLTPPKMGSAHYQLGHKLTLLDEFVEKNGSVDCVAIGSSMVDVGFNPDSFQKGYREVAGRDIRCFDFGIDASTAASAAALAKILVEDYHPRFLILGTDARDYAVPSTDRDPAVILESPWIRYRQGDFSLQGWLLEHSYLYRYRQHFGRLMRLNFEGTLQAETKLNFPILSNGYSPINKVATYINRAPDPEDPSFEVTYYTSIYSSYEMLDENLAALGSMMSFNKSTTQVVVLEMPVSDGLYYFFGHGKTDYNKFVSQVGALANLYHVPFWRTEPIDLIPDDGWSDYSHLNTKGAEIFSVWLGRQVAEAENQGTIEISHP